MRKQEHQSQREIGVVNGAVSQGMGAAWRSQKRQGTDSPQELQRHRVQYYLIEKNKINIILCVCFLVA